MNNDAQKIHSQTPALNYGKSPNFADNFMAELITLPKMSDTMTEGVIVKWTVKVGDAVKSGDVLAEVETDKATMDMEGYAKGTVLYLAPEGQAIPVDAPIAVVGNAGEAYEDLLKGGAASASSAAPEAPAPAAAPEVQAPTAPQATAATSSSDDRVKASPLAKKIAAEKGIALSGIQGSGEGGRIIKKDIESAGSAPAAVAAVSAAPMGEESFTDMPISQMRKTIAARLSESKFTAPHFYLTVEINMDKAVEAREAMNQISEVKISMNDLVVKACGMALTKHPKINSSWLGDKIRMNHHVHIGVAMAVDEGLLVPVVRFANQKSLSQISTEVKAYGAKAKEKKLQPADWQGNTFTISNLGMFGID